MLHAHTRVNQWYTYQLNGFSNTLLGDHENPQQQVQKVAQHVQPQMHIQGQMQPQIDPSTGQQIPMAAPGIQSYTKLRIVK